MGRPDWGWAAPGRVNLMGEHTDYNDGWVLPFAIGQRTRVALVARTDDRVRIWSTHAEQADVPVETTTATQPGDVDGWAAYVAGVVWAFGVHGNGQKLPGLDVWVDSEVPLGAGLSSSAALECAVAVAVDDRLGLGCGPDLLAALARRAENDYVGAPTGVMDQVASLHGRAGHVLLLDTRTMRIQHLACDLDAAGLAVLVIDTRVSHQLADGGGYAERRRECKRAAAELGVDALRDATEDTLARLGNATLARRARHVVRDNARVHKAVGQLRTGAWADLGETMLASHASLRDDFEVSCAELDAVVKASVDAGALGARMTGGGFGGSVIALVPVDRVDAVGAACVEAFAARGWREPQVFAVQPAAGAGRL